MMKESWDRNRRPKAVIARTAASRWRINNLRLDEAILLRWELLHRQLIESNNKLLRPWGEVA